ncbi:MAG: hypothetical protein M3417_08360 [Actinomycetota bacterium]|nr:hypothetical protein [Actinomycetota bacterium]
MTTITLLGRDFMVDPRVLDGEPVPGAHVHLCALADSDAALAYDQPEIQQVRRDAMAWWFDLLGERLVCCTTLALDEARYGGTLTVTREPVDWTLDPFARIFAGTLMRSDRFCPVAPPAGPVVERYGGVAWPGGHFVEDPRRTSDSIAGLTRSGADDDRRSGP